MPRNPHAKTPPLTDDQYFDLLRSQGDKCALCSASPQGKRFQHDHSHKTGATRGLLCYRCNRFLHTWMTPAWLRRAADYIEGTP